MVTRAGHSGDRAPLALAIAEAKRRLPTPAIRQAIRRDAGLSQQEVADILSIHRESVSRWERGVRRPRGILAALYVELLNDLRRGRRP